LLSQGNWGSFPRTEAIIKKILVSNKCRPAGQNEIGTHFGYLLTFVRRRTMANSFQVTQYVLDDVFVRFWNSLSFVRTANRNLEADFKNLKFATGQTIDYRLEERYLAGEGASATSEGRVQVIRPLSITKQFRTMVEYTGFNLTFDRARDEPYLEMANAPRAKRLANMVESFVAKDNFQKQTYQAVGTPGVPVDFNTVLLADAYMTELAIPEDGKRYMGVNPRVAAGISNDLYTVF